MNRASVLAMGTIILCIQVALGACGGSADGPGRGTITIEMFDNSFEPNSATVASGSTVTFKLPNRGQLPHNMHIASARGIFRESDWLSEPALSGPGLPATSDGQCPPSRVHTSSGATSMRRR